MKRALVIALMLTCPLRAAWGDLKAGLDGKTVRQAIGAPLMASKSRGGGIETWTYDAGGYVTFVNGRVNYWQLPQPKKPARTYAAAAVKPVR